MTWYRHPLCRIGAAIILAFVLAGVAAGHLTRYDPNWQDLSAQLAAPSASHWFGTDSLGRDIYSRVLYGARDSIPVSFAVVALAVALGLLLGAPAGYFGGAVDEVLMRVTDLFLAFPSLILAMAIAGALGPSLPHVLLALSISWWPSYARLVRSQVMGWRDAPFVDAVRCMGASPARILVRHVLPNCIAPVVVQATLDLGGVILTAAGLSFIGLGAQPPEPEWGSMVNAGRLYIASQWWVATFPGLAILLTGFGFNLFGDGLRDALDPRRAGR
ncbi:MAG TPA: nickel transporter permease [Candidatus Xenobia bacterium]|jgi:peptide/nickel transport system permease protein